jgi:hypothetical protein
MIALAKRISKENPFEPDVNHRTVERFLKNQHETNPLLVKWCKVFLQKVAPDPEKEMAEGLIWFYGPSNPRGWAGHYYVWFGEAKNRHSPDAIAAIADDVGFFRVRMESRRDRLIYDGVLLASGPTVSMFLKNRLTGWPCVCLLSLELEAFSGTIVETTHENRERIAKIYMIRTSYIDMDTVSGGQSKSCPLGMNNLRLLMPVRSGRSKIGSLTIPVWLLTLSRRRQD